MTHDGVFSLSIRVLHLKILCIQVFEFFAYARRKRVLVLAVVVECRIWLWSMGFCLSSSHFRSHQYRQMCYSIYTFHRRGIASYSNSVCSLCCLHQPIRLLSNIAVVLPICCNYLYLVLHSFECKLTLSALVYSRSFHIQDLIRQQMLEPAPNLSEDQASNLTHQAKFPRLTRPKRFQAHHTKTQLQDLSKPKPCLYLLTIRTLIMMQKLQKEKNSWTSGESNAGPLLC